MNGSQPSAKLSTDFGWWLFLFIVFFPPLSFLSGGILRNHLLTVVSVYLIPVCSLYGGIWAGLEIGRYTHSKVIWSIILVLGLILFNLVLIAVLIFLLATLTGRV